MSLSCYGALEIVGLLLLLLLECAIPDEECKWNAHLPSVGRQPVGG